MSITKRLLVIWASLTQSWHLEKCEDCPNTWWSDRRCVPSSGQCLECEDRAFAEWVTKRDQYEARQRANSKEVA